MSPTTQIQDNNHILGVYSSPQRKIEEGLEYLRIGFEKKNEAILMITDELTKDEVRNIIIQKWKISANELENQEKNGIINIKSSRKFYFSTNVLDYDKIVKQYSDTTNKAIEKGKRGLRAFADVRIFFERGYEKYIIEIEKSISPLYDFPLTCICAYDLDDFEKLNRHSRRALFDHHSIHLINNLSRNIFDDPHNLNFTEHICMYCEKEELEPSYSFPLSNSILQYINEGLEQGQLCVYISIHNIEKKHSKMILTQIPNLKKLYKKNFIIIKNSDDFYINATCDNLKPFEDLKKQIFEKVILDCKKEIRIVCDISNLLFKNKHFDQTIALEEWLDQTIEELNKIHGLTVSLICLYNSHNFRKLPHKFHKHRINDNHSIICNSEGVIYSKFDSLNERREK
ncbi:MAG TPA: MEDS domain-containing protein [Nitrososphaeraceae archaeon]